MKQRRPSSYVRAYMERLWEAGWWVKASETLTGNVVVQAIHPPEKESDIEYTTSEDLESALKKLCDRIGV